MIYPNDLSSCHALLEKQAIQISLLSAKVMELEARLNKNSSNSNKPPSSDGLSKKPKVKPAFSRKKGKKTGGQKGHEGKTLEFSGTPDKVIGLLSTHCSCGNILDKQQATIVEKRQVFDLPVPKLEITEYQKLGCTCSKCATYVEGAFPQEVKAYVQYGTSVRALVVLLNIAFQMPLKKIRTLFNDLYGYAINESTIKTSNKKCFENLAASEQVIKQSLLASLVVHFDETGLRVAGKLHWLHTSCTQLFTYLFIHTNRGLAALKDTVSILPNFKNWAIHDCWTSYFTFTNCTHGLCGAHIIRELVALEEQNVKWAAWFRRYLFTLYYLSKKGESTLNEVQKQKALLLFDKIWEYANFIEPPPKKTPHKKGRPKATKGRNLLNRLKEHQGAVIAFAFFENVPFTNNQAERDLRPAKTKQKVAGSFRTFEGAVIYARILGFVSTARKQQKNAFNQLKNAFSGNTFLTVNNTP